MALIMDGNRRWARERNLPTIDGHFAGYEKGQVVPDWFFNRGVKIVSLYAFSTENWNRAPEEVNYLMKLLKRAIEEKTEDALKKGHRILISGFLDELPGDLPDACRETMLKTKLGTNGTVNLCINHGGRAEILDAMKKMIINEIKPEQVHEGMIRKYLQHGELPDPDMIVRTSGEKRLSGFLLWQSAYSELMFMEKYWPEFEETDAEIILAEYAGRKRRFGGDGK